MFMASEGVVDLLLDLLLRALHLVLEGRLPLVSNSLGLQLIVVGRRSGRLLGPAGEVLCLVLHTHVIPPCRVAIAFRSDAVPDARPPTPGARAGARPSFLTGSQARA